MSVIARRRWGEVEPQVQKTFEAFFSARGNVPNLFRVLAHSPPLLRTFHSHFKTAMGPGRLEVRLKEILALRVSQLNECRYWLASHTALARQYRVPDEVIDTLHDLAHCPLPENEKAAVRFAEKMTTAHREITREDVNALREHWNEAEIVEMACVAGLFNYLNRFAVAFALEPTQPGEGGPNDLEGERPSG